MNEIWKWESRATQIPHAHEWIMKAKSKGDRKWRQNWEMKPKHALLNLAQPVLLIDGLLTGKSKTSANNDQNRSLKNINI